MSFIKKENLVIVTGQYTTQDGQQKNEHKIIGELVTMQGNDGPYQFFKIWGPHGVTDGKVWEPLDNNQQQAQHPPRQQSNQGGYQAPQGQPPPQGNYQAPAHQGGAGMMPGKPGASQGARHTPQAAPDIQAPGPVVDDFEDDIPFNRIPDFLAI